MPMITADDGCPINVEVEGSESAPVLMLSNSLGTNLHMWDDQAGEWSKHFRLVRYDRRGHGKSGVPKGPYSMERFGRDVLAFSMRSRSRRSTGAACRWAAWSGNGWAPMRPTASTSSSSPTPTINYADKGRGTTASSSCRKKASPNWSIRTWSAGSPRTSAPARRRTIARMKEMFLATNPAGYIACCEAIRDMDFTASNPRITRADAGHRRQAGPGDAAGRRRSHRQADQGRQARRARCRAYRQHGAAQALYRDGAQLPARLEDRRWTRRNATSAA